MTWLSKRKLKNFVNSKQPCMECISYAICLNKDVVDMVEQCIILSNSIAGVDEVGLGLQMPSKFARKEGYYRFYVFYKGGYLGAFWGSEDHYHGNPL